MPSPSATGARLGLVDDDRSFRRATVLCLEDAGYRVDEYDSASDFLRRRSAVPHDALILDVDLPGLTGLELQAILSGAPDAPPVIFVSGRSDVVQGVQAMRQGAVDFLVKPYRQERLLEALARALAHGARARARALERQQLEARLGGLSERERRVAELVVEGRLNKQIADALGTSENTIKVHRARAMEKLEVRSVPELVRLLDRVRALQNV
ncbi:MAG: response regulator [Anaeromyxobacter sp.]